MIQGHLHHEMAPLARQILLLVENISRIQCINKEEINNKEEK